MNILVNSKHSIKFWCSENAILFFYCSVYFLWHASKQSDHQHLISMCHITEFQMLRWVGIAGHMAFVLQSVHAVIFLRSAEESIIHCSPWISVQKCYRSLPSKSSFINTLGYIPCSFSVSFSCSSSHKPHKRLTRWEAIFVSHYFLALSSFRRYLSFSGTSLGCEKSLCYKLSSDFCPHKSTLSFSWASIPSSLSGGCGHMTEF